MKAVFITILLAELQHYVTSTTIVNQLMKSHVSIVTLFSPMLPASLEMLHCQSNKPLFVLPYGEETARNSLIEVSLKRLEDFEIKQSCSCSCSCYIAMKVLNTYTQFALPCLESLPLKGRMA
jgi:hypothetical protein